MAMNATEEFIYKGHKDGLSKHERSVHVLKKHNESVPYYIFKLDSDIAAGTRLAISYNHTAPYKRGQLLLGASL